MSDDSRDAPDIIFEGEVGECPFCDDYNGAHLGRHMVSKHTDEWSEYDRRMVWVRNGREKATIWCENHD